MTDKFKDVPMCCGTPLKDDKCTVCGDRYDENGHWVVVEASEKIIEELDKTVKSMEAIISMAHDLKKDVESALFFNKAFKRFRLYDLDSITTDLAFLEGNIEELLAEADIIELPELVAKLVTERKDRDQPYFIRQKKEGA